MLTLFARSVYLEKKISLQEQKFTQQMNDEV
jgi:hypothetical protein